MNSAQVSVAQFYLSIGKLEEQLKSIPPKKLLEQIVLSKINEIKITWLQVTKALKLSVTETTLFKEAFDYASGGAKEANLGQIVNKIKGMYSHYGVKK